MYEEALSGPSPRPPGRAGGVRVSRSRTVPGELRGRGHEVPGVLPEDHQHRRPVEHDRHPGPGSAQPRSAGHPWRAGPDHGDRCGEAPDHMTHDEIQYVVGADSRSGDQRGQPLQVPGRFVDEVGVEQTLVDQSGLDHAEGGAQQQRRRPSAPGPTRHLTDHHGDRAVERGQDEQSDEQVRAVRRPGARESAPSGGPGRAPTGGGGDGGGPSPCRQRP